MNGYVTVSSVTYAYKGKNALEKKGVNAYIERAPTEISKCGCHYSIIIKDYSIEKAVEILKAARVKIIGTGTGANDIH
jgi:hypothetical protein